MKRSEELREEIRRMDHRSYPAYKSLAGSWQFPDYILNIDHVQGDPFAAPSSLSVRISGKRAGFPGAFLATKERRTALEDQLVRRFAREVSKVTGRRAEESAEEVLGWKRGDSGAAEAVRGWHTGNRGRDGANGNRDAGNRGRDGANGNRDAGNRGRGGESRYSDAGYREQGRGGRGHASPDDRRSGEEKESYGRAQGSGKSGVIQSSRPGQEVLERTACRVDATNGDILFRFEVGFPAFGRSIAGDELIKILFDQLPGIIRRALYYNESADGAALQRVLELTDDQQALRAKLEELGLAAFVADGAVLPRESGISQRPAKQAVAFQSPESLRIQVELPHAGVVTGMGIRRGVTLIVGGGYHGKSTLLQALERGVYDHIAGDGRELVVTDRSAVKLRAEDGRSVKKDDISLFIDRLPGGRGGKDFSTENASGSTSQAANTVEAMEAGSRLFLIDEDTCATNFMIRDSLMERVVRREQEPITPFLQRVRPLYEKAGISTILVAGSSGLFFGCADTVIQMDCYVPVDITERAREAWQAYTAGQGEAGEISGAALPFVLPSFDRRPRGTGRNGGDRRKIKITGIDEFLLDKEAVQLGQVEQIVDREQTAALAHCLVYLQEKLFDGRRTLREAVEELSSLLLKEGPEALCGTRQAIPFLALPRKQEILACAARYRGLRV